MRITSFVFCFVALVCFVLGCAVKPLDLSNISIEVGRKKFWTPEAASASLGDCGYKSKAYPYGFQPIYYLKGIEGNIVKFGVYDQNIVVDSLQKIKASYTPEKIAEISGKANRTLKEVEAFKLTILGVKPPSRMADLINERPVLSKQLRADRRARVITAVLVIFDHESTQILDKGGEVEAKVTEIDGQAQFRFEVKDSTSLKTKYADGMVVGYEMNEICWNEMTQKAQSFEKDIYLYSKKIECPGGTVRGREKKKEK